MQNVIVPLNAFDRFKVLENGQESFIQLIAQSGAFGVEIRRELLPVQDPQLDKIRSEMASNGLFPVYSAPIELWKENHQLNKTELTEIFQEAMTMGAKWLKVSLGHYQHDASNINDLAAYLNQYKNIQLLVENDQTSHGGNVSQLASFFENVTDQMVPVKMTFDAGNWYYSGQSVEDALDKLAPYVLYLHLKQVEEGPITIPLQREGNHSWKKVMQHFPSTMVKALEFPIEPKEKTKDYIDLISELVLESEAISCNS
ncbi:sugar phosphate isomerase/epimerase [Paenibacillus sp. BSR1-1]|uniref:sugar phosphate isomerase/epimerase family protein n=1 Tax=Paenibacillus sp. BSR1-1 TaxID=3020845 RepID=UPI0025B1CCAA|nr:sugar phosphate isomerase/epimerase [Paenibacillus sp. BSR1-1]MDN3017961.1 sugar phosphate isomerase/epimerase [Paenibacillus sp. BSR1-1]